MAFTARTFVLVHGAWHGGWCWGRVAEVLRRDGHGVFTPTLTGLGERAHLAHAGIGLATHVTDIVNVLKWEGLGEVVLAGHSYGGFVVSGVAEQVPEAIASMVFVDAFVPENGECLLDLASPAARERFEPAIAKGDGFVPKIPAAAFNVNEQDRAWVDGLCVPQPRATFTERAALTGARERIARKTYIRAAGYPSQSFDAAAAKARASGSWRVLELPCGHDIMVDMPEKLAEILVESA